MVKIKGDRSMFIYLAIIDSPEGKLKFEVIYGPVDKVARKSFLW